MNQLSTMSQCPSYQQPRKLFGARFWKMLLAMLLVALFLFTGQEAALAAPNTAATMAHPHSALICNWRTYMLTSSLRLVDQYGFVIYLQASNLNGQNTVQVWHNGIYQGEYSLPFSDAYGRVTVYQGSTSELVNACI